MQQYRSIFFNIKLIYLPLLAYSATNNQYHEYKPLWKYILFTSVSHLISSTLHEALLFLLEVSTWISGDHGVQRFCWTKTGSLNAKRLTWCFKEIFSVSMLPDFLVDGDISKKLKYFKRVGMKRTSLLLKFKVKWYDLLEPHCLGF